MKYNFTLSWTWKTVFKSKYFILHVENENEKDKKKTNVDLTHISTVEPSCKTLG